MKTSLFAILVCLFACSCVIQSAAPNSRLQDRAVFDLNCSEQQVQVTKIDDNTYGVRGCGRQGTYLWHCVDGSRCQWVMNGAVSNTPQ